MVPYYSPPHNFSKVAVLVEFQSASFFPCHYRVCEVFIVVVSNNVLVAVVLNSVLVVVVVNDVGRCRVEQCVGRCHVEQFADGCRV